MRLDFLACALLSSLVCVFTGCASRPVGVQRAAFNEAEFQGFEREGKASLQGQVRLNLGGGRVAGAVAQRAFLVPLTPYTQEWLAMIKEGKELPAPDPRMQKYIRSAILGAFSSYGFDQLPAGKYLVYARVEWNPGGRRATYLESTYAYDVVELSAGQRKRGFNISNQ